MFSHSAHGLMGISIALIVIVVLSVGLRFWSRIVIPRITVGLDDWFALAATFPTIAVLCIGVRGGQYALGKHVNEIDSETLSWALKTYLACIMCFDIGLTIAKLSALAFYVRIFGWRNNPRRLWKIAIWFGVFLVVSYVVVDVPVTITQCRPIRKYWDQSIPGYCVSRDVVFAAMTCYNILADIYILILPMPLIYKLHMKRPKKLLVAATFVIGYSIPVMSIGRLVTAAVVGKSLSTDFTYAFIPVAEWSLAEPSISIVAISLQAMFHLAKRAWEFGPRSLLNSREYSQPDSRKNVGRENRSQSFHRLNRTGGSSETHFINGPRPGPLTSAPQPPRGRMRDVEEDVGMPIESVSGGKDERIGYAL